MTPLAKLESKIRSYNLSVFTRLMPQIALGVTAGRSVFIQASNCNPLTPHLDVPKATAWVEGYTTAAKIAYYAAERRYGTPERLDACSDCGKPLVDLP